MLSSVFQNAAELRSELARRRSPGLMLGLVPTMGALHAGHASLIALARRECDLVAVSIFVNPTQFGPSEDFSRYPRALEADREVCAQFGADLIFTPSADEIYTPGYRTYVEVTGLQDVLEGASRPGHFRGVATVVLKLFNIVQPDRAYFGQKDALQLRVIEQMVGDLNVGVELRVGPTVREPDGLALSSRNRYLDPPRRAQATVLYRALKMVENRVAAGERDAQTLRAEMERLIRETPDVDLDYAAIVDGDSFTPIESLRGRVLVAVAARVGSTRLIDNVPLHVSD